MPFSMDDLADYGTYKAALKREVAKVTATKAKFHYFSEYDFNGTKKPLLLLGVVTPAMLKAVTPKTKGMALGHCTRADDKLTLTVGKGNMGKDKLSKVLSEATVPEELVLADTDGDLTKRLKQEQEQELLALKGRKLVSEMDEKEQEGLEQAIQTGRGDREERAKRDLKSMEQIVNDKKKLVGNDRLAHGVSGHGPETDQIPRLVSGRRNDEVEEEERLGTGPTTKVKLTGNPDLPDQEVPEWTTTGKDASPVSSQFKDYTSMSLAIEEALSQAMEVQSLVAKEEKRTREKRWVEVVKTPKVNEALKLLVLMRDALDDAVQELTELPEHTSVDDARPFHEAVTELTKECAEAQQSYADLSKQAATQREQALSAAQELTAARHNLAEKLKAIEAAKKEHGAESVQVTTLTGELPALRKAFHDKRKSYAEALQKFTTAWGDQAQLPSLDDSDLDESRLVRTVTSGDITGSSLSIDDSLKVTGDKVTNDDMQRRFESIKTQEGLKQAVVVMDPDGAGGWDVQTAFPIDAPDEPRTLTETQFKKMRAEERHQKASREQQEAEKVLLDQKEEEKRLIQVVKDVKLKIDQIEQIINDQDRASEHQEASEKLIKAEEELKTATQERKEAEVLVKALDEEVKSARKRTQEAKKALDELG